MEKKLKTIKVKNEKEIPKNYTGIAKWNDGTKQWFLNGECHREDGPACEYRDGEKHWYLNDKKHRVDGPAYIGANGSKQWCLNDKLHREDGPALELASGYKVWYLFDRLLFELPPESQPFILIEEFMDEEGKEQIKVLTQDGIEIWSNLPGLKELADNWEKK